VTRAGWSRCLIPIGVIVGLIVLVGGLESLRGTAAQEATPAPASGFVGSWRVTPTSGGEAAVALTTVNADGTTLTSNRAVQPVTPGLPAGAMAQSLGHGSCRATGLRTADITFVILQSTTDGAFLGTRTIRGALELDSGGDRWSGSFSVTVADPAGLVVQQTTGSVEATRIMVERPPDVPPTDGTPIAAPPAATPPAARDAVEISGLVDQPQRLMVADLQGRASQTAEVFWIGSDRTTETRSCRGVPLV